MTPERAIGSTKYCYGCGVCVASCPKGIISMHLNNNGFYQPIITNVAECVQCGICIKVCAFYHSELAIDLKPLKSWASWSNDILIRHKCSSGGIGFEIGRKLIKKGYKVVGCRYNANEQRAEHYIASNIRELVQSIGSKYIQSYTENAFKQINRTQKYLVTGTPCQIDSFRRMIQLFRCEENFVLMDFYCHSVPSMLLWQTYLKMFKTKIGTVTHASWRNKFDYGWHDSWVMGLDGDDKAICVDQKVSFRDLFVERDCTIKSKKSQGDLFYKFFLGDVCIGPQCKKDCKYKYNRSSADVRIGDLWGETYQNNQEGVSALVAFTDQGLNLIKSMTGITLIEHPFEIVAEGQMKKNVERKEISPLVMLMLRHKISLDSPLYYLLFTFQRILSWIKRMK